MTVKVIQRIPDKDTHERHKYIKYNVGWVHFYKAFNGEMYVHLIFKDGREQHLSACLFDIEVFD